MLFTCLRSLDCVDFFTRMLKLIPQVDSSMSFLTAT
uniref:Uncharacterized protein n=1 Tax=Arundo donax TaxID=35708 RepID=A0A0A9BJG2_ARUDO